MNKKFRLTSSIDFKRVRSQGSSFAHPLVVLVTIEEPGAPSRIGVSVSKYIGNAVARNKVKRQLREIIRPLLPSIKPDRKIILIARSKINNASYAEIEQAVKHLLIKGELLLKDNHVLGTLSADGL